MAKRDRGSSDLADRTGPPPMPRWMKLSAAVVIAAALLIAGLRVAGVGGGHGPGRHGLTPPAQSVITGAVIPEAATVTTGPVT